MTPRSSELDGPLDTIGARSIGLLRSGLVEHIAHPDPIPPAPSLTPRMYHHHHGHV